MTELSPAAWQIESAASVAKDYGKNSIAAALRAAADEVAPFPGRYPMNEYMEGFRDAKQSIRLQLIAIARELEGRR